MLDVAKRAAGWFEERVSPGEQKDWRWMARALVWRWKLVLAVAVLVAALGAAYAVMRPTNFTAFAVVKVTNLVLSNSGENTFFAEAQFDPTFLETQAASITADPIILAVIESLDLARQTGGDPLRSLRLLKPSISAERLGQSSLVGIFVTAPDPQRAAEIANAMVVAYQNKLRSDRVEAANAAGSWLRERLLEVGPRAQSVAPALAPLYKSDPASAIVVAAAGAAGLTIGAALALLLAFLDRRIRSVEAAAAATGGARCLGVVPLLRGPRRRGRKKPPQQPEEGRYDALGLPPILREHGLDPFSPFAQIQRALGSPGARPEARAPRVFGVASLLTGEGRSLTAANLAFAAARSGRRTLLVDAASHDPALTRAVAPAGAAGPAGIGTILRAGTDDPAFMPFPPPSRDFAGDALPLLDAAARAADGFDLVLVDLPPLLAEGELRAAADKLDGILFVIDWNRVSADELSAALALCSPVREQIVGFVMNRARFRARERFFAPETTLLSRQRRFNARRARV